MKGIVLFFTVISVSVHWLISKIMGNKSVSLPFFYCSPNMMNASWVHPFVVLLIIIKDRWQQGYFNVRAYAISYFLHSYPGFIFEVIAWHIHLSGEVRIIVPFVFADFNIISL